jgi:hypothetical protein
MFIGVVVAAVAVLLAGSLLASNMGFKLNKTLIATGQPVPEVVADGLSQDGTNELSLPDNQQQGMVTALDLITDIGPAAKGGISKFIRDTNALCVYTGKATTPCTTNFTLTPGESYRVKITGTTNINYIVVGSHNPTLPHTLIATGQIVPENVGDGLSQDGSNAFNYPYHSVSATALDLINEIGPAAKGGVSKFIRDTNALCVYTGKATTPCTTNFALVPGEAYRIKITGAANIPFIPSHY